MGYEPDPEVSISVVAIFLFIDAAFYAIPLLSGLASGGGVSLISLLLLGALIAAGVGLLQKRPWSWYAGIAAGAFTVLLSVLRFSILGVLFGALVLYLLTRPATKARLGVR